MFPQWTVTLFALRTQGALTSKCYSQGRVTGGRTLCGDPLAPGECVRIFTGAVVPESADTVVIQENVERDDASVRMLQAHRLAQTYVVVARKLRLNLSSQLPGS